MYASQTKLCSFVFELWRLYWMVPWERECWRYLHFAIRLAGCLAGLDIPKKAKKVIGVESVPEAIEDAIANAEHNNIGNVEFFVGDMKNVFNQSFIALHGKPDIIITDPPRDGMHKDVVEQLIQVAPEKIVYVSCNSATQARDLALMKEMYQVTKVQPVDMFPQTHHVENVVLLEKRV